MRGLHFEDAVADLEDRHVERAATKVEHEDGFVFVALVEAVGERRCGRLIDNAEYFEACDGACFLRGGALGIVEVGGHGNDSLRDRVAEVALGVALELHQRAGADLLCGVLLAVDVVRLPRLAHVALHRTEGAIRVGDGLALCDFADEHFAGLRERDNGRGGAATFGVRDDDGLAAFQDRDD